MDKDIHKHQCGLEAGKFNPEKGCGHTWEHENIGLQKGTTDSEYDKAHMCPACGKGPWKWRHGEKALTPEEIADDLIALILIRAIAKRIRQEERNGDV